MANPEFNYEQAFSRNIGWVTPGELLQLRGKRVAIAGLGGVGGSHLLTLARLGVGNFNIADFDVFNLVNFNRQAGANMDTIGRRKTEVLSEMVRAVNPGISLKVFDQGITEQNMDGFLEEVDLYIDGLDFFAFKARSAVFASCAEKGIPAITAAPLGMGAAVLTFLPRGMTFEEYFRWEGCSEDEMALRFVLGLSPRLLQRKYLVDPGALDLKARKGPSTPMACDICAGMAATEALKVLLQRGRLLAAPHGLQFDPYKNKLVHTWRPWGNRNPIQRLMIGIASRQFSRMQS
ncbi:MAG: ThiF family adenylyltransferase [Acidobacteria bacterium]|nr:ThiF family adenylyltransferase [Acidobacteriota bacterium]